MKSKNGKLKINGTNHHEKHENQQRRSEEGACAIQWAIEEEKYQSA